jgi:AT-rich interactive domain-containing protein 1
MRQPYRPPDMRVSGPGMQRPGFPGRGGRNDMAFPPGSIEATIPLMLKRRKYTKVDVQPVDGWRLVLALRSGLLMESTWALDVINVLLFDDYAVSYFGLGNMPGLLEALLEHWRSSLINMFGITEDLESSTEKCSERRTRKRSRVLEKAKGRKWFEPSQMTSLHTEHSNIEEDDSEGEMDAALGRVKDIDPKDKQTVLTSETSYTKRPRFAEEDVEVIDRDDDIFITNDERSWDDGDVMTHGYMHWLNGGGNTTEHIVSHFAADLGIVPFVRVLKELGSKSFKKSSELDKVKAKEAIIISYKKEQEVKENGGAHIKAEEAESEQLPIKKEAKEEPPEDIIEKIQRLTGIVITDPDMVRKRWAEEALEDENYVHDEPSLKLVSEANDNVGRRAACISNILRNLSFVPGNEYELARNAPFLAIAGRLLLFKHWHPPRNASKQKNYDRGEEEETAESCTSLTGDEEWWWEYLHVIRENVMVALSNIAGSLELNDYQEEISRPILNGLLEWAVSTSAYAQDPFPNVGPHSPISPQGLAIETLCKLCLHESNVDLMLCTPPYRRIEKLTLMLAKKLYRYEDQVLREFSINLLYYLSAADSGVARTIAMSDLTIGLLLGFIEQAEQNAMVIAQKHGVNALRDNPDSMGTSLDMLRRAASTLSNLSRHPDNISLFMRQEQRLLALVMSQILDQGVASILSHVLFNIGLNSQTSPITTKKPTAAASSSGASSVTSEKLCTTAES